MENSLTDKKILTQLKVLKSWVDGDWKLHKVMLNRDQALNLAQYLKDGLWYMHFWEPNKENILVVFRNKNFDITYSNRSTWGPVLEYGKLLGIPEQQLDFLID